MAYAWRDEDRYPLGGEDRFSAFRGGTFRREDLRLTRLKDLGDWQIAEGEPDIRGWNIIDREGNQLGQIEDLIASPVNRTVYFLIAQVGGVLGFGGKHVIVPLDVIHLDRDNQQVRLNATREDLENAPEWRADTDVDYVSGYSYWQDRIGMFTAEGTRERELAGMRGGEAPSTSETRVPLREEEMVTRRERHAGEVSVEKHVVAEEHQIDVPVTHTEVSVERHRVTGRERELGKGEIGESEVRIPVMEEEAHVEKRNVVNEEIVVRQRPVTETERHKETLRREVAEVHSEGDVDVKGDIDVK